MFCSENTTLENSIRAASWHGVVLKRPFLSRATRICSGPQGNELKTYASARAVSAIIAACCCCSRGPGHSCKGPLKSYTKIARFLAFVFLLSAGLSSLWLLRPVHTHARISISSDNPKELLAGANRLAWLGNWHAAASLYKKAEERFHSVGDEENEAYARIGVIRAQAFQTRSDQVLSALDIELKEPVVTHNSRLRMWCLAQRASTEIDIDSNAAKRDWTEVRDLATRLGEKQWAARADGELGLIAFLNGDTAEAVSLLGKSIFSAYRSGDTASQVRLLSLLGLGFNEEQRYSEALTLFNHAIGTANSSPDSGFPFLAFRGQAAALAGVGQLDRATQVLGTALNAARGQNDRVHEADLLIESGKVAIDRNDISEAEASFRQAGQIAEALKLYRTLDESMFELAKVERQLGKTQAAVRAVQIALTASGRLGERYYLPRDLTALAEIQIVQGKLGEADKFFEKAEDVLDGILANEHSFEESTARAGSMSSTYLEHFRLAVTMGRKKRAFEVLERVRGRTVASKLFLRDQAGARSPRIEQLNGAIAATQLALLHTDDRKRRSDLMEQLLEDERKLAFELNEAGLKRKDTLALPASLREVQGLLHDDEVLAEYVLDEPHAFCIALSRTAVQIVTLPAGKSRIEGLTKSYLSELKAKAMGKQSAMDLYGLLVEPLLSRFPQSHLIISPDGIVNALPFEALRNDAGYLVQSKVISYTPSGTVLWRLRSAKPIETPQPLLAVGAVDYRLMRAMSKTYSPGSITATVLRGLSELSGSKLEDLPGSRSEVLTIARIAGPEAKLLLGESATETEFKKQNLEQFRVIHFATHATADPRYPDRAALVLAPAPNTADDGLLQLREIMHLSLKADLVTLSACETEVGTNQGEAGVVNLEQAFLIAGARAVVASLWNVEDRSTTTLMKSFYEHLAQHEDKAEALAHAKLDIIEKYPDVAPYYWAAFVMVGQGAEEVPFGK